MSRPIRGQGGHLGFWIALKRYNTFSEPIEKNLWKFGNKECSGPKEMWLLFRANLVENCTLYRLYNLFFYKNETLSGCLSSCIQ